MVLKVSYAINHHKGITIYKGQAKNLLYKYHFTNPDVYKLEKNVRGNNLS